MARKVYTFRLDEELVEDARASGLDLRHVFEKTLEKHLKTKRCPTCRQVTKNNPKKSD